CLVGLILRCRCLPVLLISTFTARWGAESAAAITASSSSLPLAAAAAIALPPDSSRISFADRWAVADDALDDRARLSPLCLAAERVFSTTAAAAVPVVK